jgi:cytochrome c oxidase cbb3-type subunit III
MFLVSDSGHKFYMSYRRFSLMMIVSLTVFATSAAAQRGGRGAAGATAAPSGPQPIDITTNRAFDKAAVERGGKIFDAKCASCHGDNARGGNGKSGADLIRSSIVQMDHGGHDLPEFLKVGRPDKGMPKFDLSHDEGVDVAIWLHYQVTVAADRGAYVKYNIFSGDAKAGEAFFNGPVGKCNTCHSVTGNLKGIGEKNNHDAPTLQSAILAGGRAIGRGGGRGGRGGGGGGAPPGEGGGGGGGGGGGAGVTTTVTQKDGQKFIGTPAMINDFVVEIRLPDGDTKTWLRNGEWPKVTQVNRLQAHIDLMFKYTDDDIHNLAAYLNDK